MRWTVGRGLREIQTLLWVLRGRDVCRETLADFTERKAHVDLKERAGLQCMEVGKGGCSRPTFLVAREKPNSDYFMKRVLLQEVHGLN